MRTILVLVALAGCNSDRLTKLETNDKGLATGILQLNDGHVAQQRDIDSLESEIAGLRSEITDLQSKLDALATDVRGPGVLSIEFRLDSVETKVRRLGYGGY